MKIKILKIICKFFSKNKYKIKKQKIFRSIFKKFFNRINNKIYKQKNNYL